MIKTVALEKIFRTEEVETWALNKVNIEVKEGEFVAIMGPSGCGKSTLLNILGLLDNPTSGEYYLNGIEVSKYTEAQRTKLRKGIIGFVFQSFNLIDELNVYENIELPPPLYGCFGFRTQTESERGHGTYGIVHRENISLNSYPEVSNSVLPLPVPLSPTRRSSLPMSRPVTWTLRWVPKSWNCCTA